MPQKKNPFPTSQLAYGIQHSPGVAGRIRLCRHCPFITQKGEAWLNVMNSTHTHVKERQLLVFWKCASPSTCFSTLLSLPRLSSVVPAPFAFRSRAKRTGLATLKNRFTFFPSFRFRFLGGCRTALLTCAYGFSVSFRREPVL